MCHPVLIQQNYGTYFFNRSWAEYKVGFGYHWDNYWIGNDRLSELTANGSCRLQIYLQQRGTGNWYYAHYDSFKVRSEAYNYLLEVDGYSGSAGRDAFGANNNCMFSTYDRDNDNFRFNCALAFGGGFWYNNQTCTWCDLNSSPVNGSNYFWWLLPGDVYDYQLQASMMWLLVC